MEVGKPSATNPTGAAADAPPPADGGGAPAGGAQAAQPGGTPAPETKPLPPRPGEAGSGDPKWFAKRLSQSREAEAKRNGFASYEAQQTWIAQQKARASQPPKPKPGVRPPPNQAELDRYRQQAAEATARVEQMEAERQHDAMAAEFTSMATRAGINDDGYAAYAFYKAIESEDPGYLDEILSGDPSWRSGWMTQKLDELKKKSPYLFRSATPAPPGSTAPEGGRPPQPSPGGNNSPLPEPKHLRDMDPKSSEYQALAKRHGLRSTGRHT